MKARILFVCLGNICRSPMAEAVMRHSVQLAGLSEAIEVDSAGTGDWHLGHPPHEGTRKQLDLYGISYEGMRSRLVTVADFDTFDYIVCMDSKNLHDVQKLINDAGIKSGTSLAEGESGSSSTRKQLFTFMELLPNEGVKDVPDPYYDGNFPYVYELVNNGCKALLDIIKKDLKLA